MTELGIEPRNSWPVSNDVTTQISGRNYLVTVFYPLASTEIYVKTMYPS